MKNFFKSKKTWIALSICAALALSITLGVVFTQRADRAKVLNNYTLKDTSAALGSATNPYTILEIVPDESYAQVGYLIDGCEPVKLDDILTNATAEAAYNAAFTTGENPVASAASDNVNYCFNDDKPATIDPSAFTAIADVTPGQVTGFSQFGYYTYNGDGASKYDYDSTDKTFKANAGNTGDYSWTAIGYFKEVDAGTGLWDRTNTGTENYTDQDCSIGGAFLYGTSSPANYNYVSLAGADNSNLLANVIDPHTDDSMLTGAPTAGDRFYYIRTEATYYQYTTNTLTNNDTFLKEVVGNTVANGYNAQVVTATPAMLTASTAAEDACGTKNIINTADFIIIHDMTTGNAINTVADPTTYPAAANTAFSTTNDLDWNTVSALITREAGGNPAPIVFDESAVAASGANTLLTKLYNALNTDGAKLFYNKNIQRNNNGTSALKAMGQIAWADAFTVGSNTDAIGSSYFVYNFGGDNSLFTTDFTNTNKIARATNVNVPAFDMLGMSDGTISPAQMLGALRRQSAGEGQPRKLSALELEPVNSFVYKESDPASWTTQYISIAPWFIGTDPDVTKDLTVETQTIYQFNSKVEDINAKYNIIFIGAKYQEDNNGDGDYNDDVDYVGNKYNDTSLNGNIYTAVGDLVSTYAANGQYTIFDQSDYRFQDYVSYVLTNDDNYRIISDNKGSDVYQLQLRYSAKDLTKKKYDALLDFAKGGAIVVHDDLYADGALDKSSYVYMLVNDRNADGSSSGVNGSKGVHTYKYSNAVASKGAQINENLTVNRCEMIFSDNPYQSNDDSVSDDLKGRPTEYDEASSSYNSQKNSSNKDVMEYFFTVDGDASKTYELGLYIDTDGNGIFQGCITQMNEAVANSADLSAVMSEKAGSLTIFDVTAGMYVYDQKLYAGHTYRVVRNILDSEMGLIPWQLELNEVGNTSNRDVETGYTRKKVTKKTVIKVLQMNPSYNMKTNNSANLGNNATFKNLVRNLDDWDVQITFMENTEWYNKYANNRDAWVRYLLSDQVDMLMLGFRDMATITNNKVFLYGFEEFRKAGKSILLSHDMNAPLAFGNHDYAVDLEDGTIDESKRLTGDVAYYIRRVSGQLRKYYNPSEYYKNGDASFNYGTDIYSNGRNVGTSQFMDDFRVRVVIWRNPFSNYNKYFGHELYDYQFDTTQAASGNYAFLHQDKRAFNLGDNANFAPLYYGSLLYKSHTQYVGFWPFGHDETVIDYQANLDRALPAGRKYSDLKWRSFADTHYVKMTNEGQITKYPYKLPEVIKTNLTHSQNFALDLEYDEDGDAMVWYDLYGQGSDGDLYLTKPNDSQNHYYIYTKGNVTYTGMGHNGVSMTNDECKIFVNTMIAAYRSASAAPYSTVVNQDAINNGSKTTLYVEEREQLNDADKTRSIQYMINDDTINTNIRDKREYYLTIEKYHYNRTDGSWISDGKVYDRKKLDHSLIGAIQSLNFNYDDVAQNEQIKYAITVNSTYSLTGKAEDYTPETTDVREVIVSMMPMFGLY